MAKKVILFAAIIFAIGIGAIYFYRTQKNDDNQPTPTPSVTETPIVTIDTIIPPPQTTTFPDSSPKGYDHFFEKYPKISGQQGYVAYPKTIQVDTPPSIVIYYHGSTQQISTNFNDQVMKNMRSYGNYFTEKNVVFLASNQHGDNWGSKQAVEDSRALISWVKKNYPTANVTYVLGFSMGGMPALKHVILYPKEVKKIALLAPAQQVETYTAAQIKLFRDVPLKIWHGTADTNVPYWVTEELVSYFKKQNTPVTVVTLKGKTHWDVDTEYMKDVATYFLGDSSK